PIPTAPQQQRRLFGVGALTAVAPVALDAQFLAPAEQPGPPRIRAVLAGECLAAGRAAPPVPRAAAGELPQRLEKRGAALDNVHGHCHLGRFSTSYGGSCPPSPPAAHQHALGTES